jgi:hypothetical protein
MNTHLLAAAFAIVATPIFAEGVVLSHEANTEYNTVSESMTATYTPTVSYTTGALLVEVASAISLYDSTATDNWAIQNLTVSGYRPDLDLTLTYTLTPSLEAYVETGWDIDASARKDVVIGTTFSF